MHLCSTEMQRDPEQLIEFFRINQIEKSFIASAMLSLIASSLAQTKLQVIHTGGEAFHSCDLPEAVTVFNEYGPTEGTVCVSQKKLDGGQITIGKPIANVRLYILNEYQKMLPIGALGELNISGIGVARGYLNRPELTEAYFISNPFATESEKDKGHTRLYRTGDLVRWRQDGKLEYLGCNDQQIKMRGYRIEPGEIANVLTARDKITQAVLIDVKQGESKVLIAYVVPKDKNNTDATELKRSLLKHLPEYMIPSSIVLVDTIPVTINGKVDRRALPEPVCEKTEYYCAPRTELESSLCSIWQSVLGIECIGIEDDFFQLGGDSISALKSQAKMRSTLSINVSLSSLFSNPRISYIK